jgi:hypothetical protein
MKKFRKLATRIGALSGILSFLFAVSMFFAVFGMMYTYKTQLVFQELFTRTNTDLYEQKSKLVLGESTDINYEDSRVASLEKFLQKYDSPLVPYARFLVETADKNGLHYGLLPAIAMVESNLCKKIIPDSYNCWGWGIYGKTVTRFSSFEEGIDTVARGLKKNYVDQGLDTPEKIMTRYNPTNHNNWLGSVNFFLSVLQ